MTGNGYTSIQDRCREITTRMDPMVSAQALCGILQEYFPLDWMNLAVADSSSQKLRYLALITEAQTMHVDETVKLSKKGRAEIEHLIKEKIVRWHDVGVTNLGRDINAYFEITEPISSITAIKQLDSSRYAALGLVATGCDRYDDTHHELFKALYDPLAGAISHILNQLEMSSLTSRLTLENRDLKRRLGDLSGRGVVGLDTGLQNVITRVKQVAALDSAVLLVGETGVGKEVIAKEIHQRSKRAGKPIVSVNCGAIPEGLVDSELFGHEKGSFTGAYSLKRGYFEQADGGTVFLDEIGELTSQAQVRLLRVLQNKEFQRVGGSRTLTIDVRIIAATNRNLAEMVKKEQFRMDLWFRINVIPIEIPPLLERKEDIPALAEYFVKQKSREMNLSYDAVLTPQAVAQLQAYAWPGNVRELQNIIERELIISQGRPLSFRDLVAPSEQPPQDESGNTPDRFLKMDELIARHIRRALSLTNGRIAGQGGAAELLGMHPSTLRGRMRKHAIRISKEVNG